MTDTTTTAPDAPAPSLTPAPDPGQPTEPITGATEQAQDDDDDLDLLADDGDDDGGSGDVPAADADAPRSPWQRPDGLEGDALSAWKEQQGLPTAAADYEVELDLREGETISDVGQQLIDGLRGFAVEHDLPAPAVSKLAQWYDKQVKGLQAKLAEGDKTQRKATRDTLTQKWAGAYEQRMAVAKEGAKIFPDSVREMLKVARMPDGRRVSDTPEFAEALLALGRLSQKGKPVPTSDDARLTEITKVLNTDVDRYRRDGLDKEHLDIMRRRDAPQTRTGTLTPAEQAEERDIVQLMHENIGAYQHKMWRGSGRTASERAMELARKRAGETA